MANQEHLALLEIEKKWLIWRHNNPQITPDLREINLTGKNLPTI